MERAIFRDTVHSRGLGSDRNAGDRRRHREKLKKQFQEGIADTISEESIIGQDRNKIIKVPIRGLKEYRFIYGDNTPVVGQGDGNSQPGQVIGKKPGEGKTVDEKAGDQPGVDFYETDITLEEILGIMFEDLELPDMEKKALRYITSERESKKKGYRKVGIRVRLDKRRTAKKHLRRAIAGGFLNIKKDYGPELTEEEYQKIAASLENKPQEQLRFSLSYMLDKDRSGIRIWRLPWDREDLMFRHMEPELKEESNAVVFCVMDTSGSMDTAKKYLARAFFFLLYQYVLTKYQTVEVVFIAHTTEAQKVTEEEFFHKGESGGTFISSGSNKTLEIIAESYHPALWNIYVFHCSDGDNFESDNNDAVNAALLLCKVANLFGYVEIKPGGGSYYESSMMQIYKRRIEATNFAMGQIVKKGDVWPTFQSILKKEKVKEG